MERTKLLPDGVLRRQTAGLGPIQAGWAVATEARLGSVGDN